MKSSKMTSVDVQFIEREGSTEDVYRIHITNQSAVSYVNDKETGMFELAPSEIARILAAHTANEAFAILKE